MRKKACPSVKAQISVISASPLTIAGMVFFFSGLGFKISLVPLPSLKSAAAVVLRLRWLQVRFQLRKSKKTAKTKKTPFAEETKACVAVFYCSVSSQVAGLLFFEGADVHVLSEINSFAVLMSGKDNGKGYLPFNEAIRHSCKKKENFRRYNKEKQNGQACERKLARP